MSIWNPDRPPFPGLRALEREDAALYFGREQELDSVLTDLERQFQNRQRSVLVIQGGSGIGKSSFVRAGLLPRLARNPGQWLVLPPLARYGNPLRDLVAVVASKWPLAAELLPVDPEIDAQRLATLLDQALRANCQPPDARAVLVLDQAEALTSESIVGRAGTFLRLVEALCAAEDAPLFLVVVIRSDAFPRLAELLNLGPEHAQIVGLGALDTAALVRIVEGPARVARIPVDSGLAAQMAADTGGSDSLPLLAYTLREMRGRRTDHRLTTEQYGLLGGISGAIAGQLTFLDQVATEELKALRRAFGALVSATDSGVFVRRAAAWTKLPHEAHRVLDQLVDRRLLHRLQVNGVDSVELAHESLLVHWPELAAWVDENAEFLRWRRSFVPLVKAWQRNERADEDLLRGRQLSDARAWYQQRETDFGPDEAEFVEASDRREREEQEAFRTLYRRAEALRLAAVAEGLVKEQFGGEPSVPLHLAIASAELMPTLEGDRALRAALKLVPEIEYDENFGSRIVTLAVSDDGRFWTSGQVDGSCRLHNAETHEEIGRFTHQDRTIDSRTGVVRYLGRPPTFTFTLPNAVTDLAISADGRRIAIAAEDGSACVLALLGLEILATVRHGETVRAVDLNRDGTRLATAAEDNVATVYDIDGGVELCRVVHSEAVFDVAFSPDGACVATAGADRTARVTWLDEGTRPQVLVETLGAVTRVVFSPDGSAVATAGQECVVFDPANGDEIARLAHEHDVCAVVFDPSGARLATVETRRTSRVFDVRTGIQLTTVAGHYWFMSGTTLAVSRDGRSVAVGYNNGAVFVYEIEDGTEQART